jgi:pyruvate dehydrogenase E2 component (dihydrolipoamide acetyltransferase)
MEVRVPDMGNFKDVAIIDVLVKPGEPVEVDTPLVTLESDKATMDVPSTAGGIVEKVHVAKGGTVSTGDLIATVRAAADGGAQAADARPAVAPPPPPKPAPAPAAAPPAAPAPAAAPASAERPGKLVPLSALGTPTSYRPDLPAIDEPGFSRAHAGPSVRKFARELGVDLHRVSGTGPKGRILQADVQTFVKQAINTPAAAPAGVGVGGLTLLPWPKVDFAKFGPVDTHPLSRIKKIAGANLARNWVMIPHVTNNDEADITELEAFRVQVNRENEKSGLKLTLLAFLIKACVAALKRFPEFNASLDGDNLVYKRYYNIGFAADTPNGLVVPVIREADRKGVLELAGESAALAAKAREGKLAPAEMQGGTFSISSLGGIGGTGFTPIINAPEVAILGVSKSIMKAVWNGAEFKPRLILPLSLSYDHRVIDGATGARFNAFLAQLLADMRRGLL